MDMDRITQTEVGPHFDHRLDILISELNLAMVDHPTSFQHRA